MLGRIKFWILKWLLDDICINSSCNNCRLSGESIIGDYLNFTCEEDDIFIQARKAWGLEKKGE